MAWRRSGKTGESVAYDSGSTNQGATNLFEAYATWVSDAAFALKAPEQAEGLFFGRRYASPLSGRYNSGRKRPESPKWKGPMIQPIRYRIQTITMVIAALAVFMVALRWAVQADDTLILASIVVLVGPIAVCGWIRRRGQRQLSKSRPFVRVAGQRGEPKRS